VPIEDIRQRRYRFWGEPGGIHDGHCINFLEAEGRWYLYDVCFFDHGIALERFELPPTDHRRIEIGTQGTLRSAYLDKAVSFMLSLEADGHYFECSHGAHCWSWQAPAAGEWVERAHGDRSRHRAGDHLPVGTMRGER
jgi:hypothetical protein